MTSKDRTKQLWCSYLGAVDIVKREGHIGSYRMAIAKKMNVSVQQVDRYSKFEKAIVKIQNMVFDGYVGLSSVEPIATHCEYEQTQIYAIMLEVKEDGISLTRPLVNCIVDGYRNGMRSWKEMKDAYPDLIKTRDKGNIIKVKSRIST